MVELYIYSIYIYVCVCVCLLQPRWLDPTIEYNWAIWDYKDSY